MPVISVHGNKTIIFIYIAVFATMMSLCGYKLLEVKVQLRMNMREYEHITSELEACNSNIVKGADL